MARTHELVYALNAGGVDREALSRIDLEKLRLAGEHPVSNWLPRVMGPMTIRPGLGSLARLPADAVTRLVPFERDIDTSVVLAFQDSTMSVYDNGEPVQVLNSASAIANPTFASALSGTFTGGWRDDSETGDGIDGVASVAGGVLTLRATRYRSASVQQAVTIAGGDQATPHTVRVDVQRGPVFLRMGTAQDTENLMTETRLVTGTHKLTVTPNAAALWIKVRSEDDSVARIVTRIQFEHTILGGAGTLVLPTPWAAADLPFLSWDQSIDVLFIGDGTHQPRRIERRGQRSWSISLYQTRGGPLVTPTTDKIWLTPSAYTGNGVLTANLPYFTPEHVGGLFELTHDEQNVAAELSGEGQASSHITVRGVFSTAVASLDRTFTLQALYSPGSFVGSVTLERSTDTEAEVWSTYATYNSNTSIGINDQQTNIVIHYRWRVTSYTSGYVNVTLTYPTGTAVGLVRITGYMSSTSVSYEVVNPLGSLKRTSNFRGPAWSDTLGWPRVPRFRDGRLHWFRGDTDYGSSVDDFDNYDDSEEGDAAPFVRTVGSGGAAGVRWALDMDKLAIGASSFVASVQASDLSEALTPTNFSVRRGPSIGASIVPPAQVDNRAIMVDRSGTRLYEFGAQGAGTALEASDVTRLNPSSVASGVVAMAVQRQPDTRIYCVLGDGTCAVVTFEREDKVTAITMFSTPGGVLEDVCVIPGVGQDRVYFVTRRNDTQRYLERIAPEGEQKATATFAGLDAFRVLSNVSAITGATHLAGQTVHVFADGRYRGAFALDGAGSAALGETYTRVVYGLSFDAEYLSVKLGYGAQIGSAIGQTKIIRQATPVLSSSVLDGIRIGTSAAFHDPMPDIVDGAERTPGQFFDHYDKMTFPVESDWTTDSRLYVKASSHHGPVTVQSIVMDIETREGLSAQGRN